MTVGQPRDKHGVRFVFKKMMYCGMALNLNIMWERGWLSLKLEK